MNKENVNKQLNYHMILEFCLLTYVDKFISLFWFFMARLFIFGFLFEFALCQEYCPGPFYGLCMCVSVNTTTWVIWSILISLSFPLLSSLLCSHNNLKNTVGADWTMRTVRLLVGKTGSNYLWPLGFQWVVWPRIGSYSLTKLHIVQSMQLQHSSVTHIWVEVRPFEKFSLLI